MHFARRHGGEQPRIQFMQIPVIAHIPALNTLFWFFSVFAFLCIFLRVLRVLRANYFEFSTLVALVLNPSNFAPVLACGLN